MLMQRIKEEILIFKNTKTFSQLAEIFGFSTSTFYRIIKKDNYSLTLKNIKKLILNSSVSFNYFIGVTDCKSISKINPHYSDSKFKYRFLLAPLSKENRETFIFMINLLTYTYNQSSSNFQKSPNIYIDRGTSAFNSERFRNILTLTGYNSHSLAKAIGCDAALVDKWKYNRIPSIENIEAIVRVCQCSGDYLLDISDDPNIQYTDNNYIEIENINPEYIHDVYKYYNMLMKRNNLDEND